MDALMNAIGVAGVSLILLAYYLLQKEKVTADAPRYLWLNLVGASLFLVSVFWDWNLSAFIIELAWIAVSAYGLMKHYRKENV